MDRASGYGGHHENYVRLVDGVYQISLAWLAAVENALNPGWVPGSNAERGGKATALGSRSLALSPYVSGRSRHWIKSKDPAAPAVKREAEEDWAAKRWR
jgi:hypothetical protein